MEIEHRENERRFVAWLPEGDATLEYELASGVMDILSTYVPPEARGRGIAAALVAAALAHARANQWRIIPTCWYVGQWLTEHPAERDLLHR